MAARAKTRRLVLEIRFDVQPIKGRLLDDTSERPFSGWIGLMAAIGAARPDAGSREISATRDRRATPAVDPNP
jgi:hypothetical protein